MSTIPQQQLHSKGSSNHQRNLLVAAHHDNNNDNDKSETTTKFYPPSRCVIDSETGEKWRLCSGAAVLNSKNQLLVGKRVLSSSSPNISEDQQQWQAPQGGVDDTYEDNNGVTKDKETIEDASHRELYEEMGLVVGKHVMQISSTPTSDSGIRYRTNGTSNWLTKSGFVGQEIHWTIYRCVDAVGNCRDPKHMCDLSGKNGEHAEFTDVKWENIDSVVNQIWEKKRETYQYLEKLIQECVKIWENQVTSWDITGTWSRDSSQSTGLIEGLQKRGLTVEEATKEVSKPYIQSWKKQSGNSNNDESSPSWIVTTYDVDGKTPRRELEYKIGEWNEEYTGNAVLFGESSGKDKVTLKRHTEFVAEPDANNPTCPMIAHVTLTDGPKGLEETRRYIKDENLIVRRSYWPMSETCVDPIVSTEVFQRVKGEDEDAEENENTGVTTRRSPHEEAIQAALEASKKFGPQSPEARVAWEIAEEIEDSIFSPCSKRYSKRRFYFAFDS